MCWYCGCNTSVTGRDEPLVAYTDSLIEEIGFVTTHIGRRLPITHLHFGGGTPTILPPAEFLRLIETIRRRFDLRTDAEIAIEIDPRSLSPEMIGALSAAAISRASIGVQSLDPAVQKAVNRIQSFAVTARAVEGLRAAGVRAINLDLIYGLPLQTVQSCLDTVEACLALRPDRFAVFGYAHVPGFKKHQQKIDTALLPDGPARNAQAEAIAGRICAAGYRAIGIDHFALPSDPMSQAAATGTLRRNFQGYTTDPAALLIGLGASAIGRMPQGFVQNEPIVKSYMAALATGRLPTAKGFVLGESDRLRAALIERLMCEFRVDIAAVCKDHHATLNCVADAFPQLERLAAAGLIRMTGNTIAVAPDATRLVRAVAASFDAYRARSLRQHSPAL